MTGDHQHARREDHWDDLLGDEADVHDDLDVFGFAHGEADEADLGVPSQPVDAAGPCRPRTFLRRRGSGSHPAPRVDRGAPGPTRPRGSIAAPAGGGPRWCWARCSWRSPSWSG